MLLASPGLSLRLTACLSTWLVLRSLFSPPFCLQLKISSNAGGNSDAVISQQNPSVKLNADGPYSANIVFETTCLTGMPGTMTTQTVGLSNSGNINYLTFPASDYIFYDPTVGFTSNGVGSIGVSLLAVLVAALAAFYSY